MVGQVITKTYQVVPGGMVRLNNGHEAALDGARSDRRAHVSPPKSLPAIIGTVADDVCLYCLRKISLAPFLRLRDSRHALPMRLLTRVRPFC